MPGAAPPQPRGGSERVWRMRVGPEPGHEGDTRTVAPRHRPQGRAFGFDTKAKTPKAKTRCDAIKRSASPQRRGPAGRWGPLGDGRKHSQTMSPLRGHRPERRELLQSQRHIGLMRQWAGTRTDISPKRPHRGPSGSETALRDPDHRHQVQIKPPGATTSPVLHSVAVTPKTSDNQCQRGRGGAGVLLGAANGCGHYGKQSRSPSGH